MRLFFKIILVCGALIVGAVLFITFDAPVAADFTDNYLRPVLGDKIIITLEKIFYNTSDAVSRATFHGQVTLPATNQTTATDNLPGNRLNLAPVDGKNAWHARLSPLFPGQEVMATSFIQPDTDRLYAVVTLLQIDTKAIALGAVAGIKQPGGSLGHPGPGVIPPALLQSGKLVAAFEGGFLYNDGNYGMTVGDTVYAPLQNNVGTLVGYKDGSLKIINYTGQDLGKEVVFARQNCPLLLENGTLSVLDPKNKVAWGRTLTSGIYTRRSGLGITKEGNLIYAAGNNITPLTLSYALRAAGAVDAIQLDINPAWVSFDFFSQPSPGVYAATPLNKEYRNRSKQFLNGYNKDFFYLYARFLKY